MSSTGNDDVRVAELVERLLADAGFRAEFRLDPVGSCRALGLEGLAAELSAGSGVSALELRESKSSLAGVVMAVAAEGVAVVELQGLLGGHGHGLSGVDKRLLGAAGVKGPRAPRLLSGLMHRGGRGVLGGGHGGLSGSHAAGAGAPAAGAAGASGAGAAGAGGAAGAPGAAGVGGAAAGGVASTGGVAAGGAPGAAGGGVVGRAAGEVVVVHGPQGASGAGVSGAGGQGPVADGAADSGSGRRHPGAPGRRCGDPGPGGRGDPGPSSAGGAVTPAPAPAGGAVTRPRRRGPAGGGCRWWVVGVAPSAVALGLLSNPRLQMPAGAQALFSSGQADPRLVGLLASALAHHTITLGTVAQITDPVHAQAIDIIAVDGQAIGPTNFAARDLITEIAALDPSARPSEITTPWPIEAQGFFTDPQHPAQLHLAFTSPSDYQPTPTPAGAAPGAAPGAAAAAVPVSGPTPDTPAAQGAAQAAAQALAAPPPTPAASAPPTPTPNPTPAGGSVLPTPTPATSSAAAGIAAAATPGAAAGIQTSGGGAAAALAYAKSMIGKLPELGGNNIGPALDRFEADYGFHGAAWCGIFVGHALQAAGLQVPHSVASVASILDLAQSGSGPFEKGILPVSAIRPGDLVTFGGTEHVAIVTSVDAQGIHTIAGNTGQSNVSETLYSPGDVTGVVRPKYAAGLLDPRVMPAVAPASAVAPTPVAPALAATPSAAPVSAAAQAEAAISAQNVQAAGAAPAPATAQFRALGPKQGPAAHPTARFMAAVQPQAAPAPAPSAVPGTAAPGQNPLGVVAGQPAAAQTPAAAVPASDQTPGIGAGQVADLVPGSSGYPGDGAPKSAIARWMADEAQRRGLPRELPVMAALVESDLHNDAGGDRDSVGYFQMRTSIWDSGPYAGYTHNPELQLKWFLDQAVALKNDATTDPSQYGNWIADVERPAEQYRGRYQLHLDEARQLLGGG